MWEQLFCSPFLACETICISHTGGVRTPVFGSVLPYYFDQNSMISVRSRCICGSRLKMIKIDEIDRFYAFAYSSVIFLEISVAKLLCIFKSDRWMHSCRCGWMGDGVGTCGLKIESDLKCKRRQDKHTLHPFNCWPIEMCATTQRVRERESAYGQLKWEKMWCCQISQS